MSAAGRIRLAFAGALLALFAAAPAARAQGEPPFIYWDNTQTSALGRATLDGGNVEQHVLSPIRTGLAADGQYVYWGQGGVLWRAALDGSGAEQLAVLSSGIQSIALDDHYIYVSAPSWVSRMTLDGKNFVEQFLPSGHGIYGGLAVDDQYIYWNADGSIGRAVLDGTGIDPGFIGGTARGFGIAVSGEHIYWSDQAGGSIGRANLDGSGVDASFIRYLPTPGLVSAHGGPRGLALDAQHIYWANGYGCDTTYSPPVCTGGTVGRANLDGSGVADPFIPAQGGVGPGCGNDPPVRCGPEYVAVSAPTQPACV